MIELRVPFFMRAMVYHKGLDVLIDETEIEIMDLEESKQSLLESKDNMKHLAKLAKSFKVNTRELKCQISECDFLLSEVQELIGNGKTSLSILKSIPHQILIEEYKSLNQDSKCITGFY